MKKIWQIILVIIFILALVLGITRFDSLTGGIQTSQQPADQK